MRQRNNYAEKCIQQWTQEDLRLLTLDRKHLARCRFIACPIFKVQWDFKDWSTEQPGACSMSSENDLQEKEILLGWQNLNYLPSPKKENNLHSNFPTWQEVVFLHNVLSKAKLHSCRLTSQNLTDSPKFLFNRDNQNMILYIDYLLLFLPCLNSSWAVCIPLSRSFYAARPGLQQSQRTLQWALQECRGPG